MKCHVSVGVVCDCLPSAFIYYGSVYGLLGLLLLHYIPISQFVISIKHNKCQLYSKSNPHRPHTGSGDCGVGHLAESLDPSVTEPRDLPLAAIERITFTLCSCCVSTVICALSLDHCSLCNLITHLSAHRFSTANLEQSCLNGLTDNLTVSSTCAAESLHGTS